MAKPVFPKEILDLVTQAPVIIGESKEQYAALYVGTVRTLKPVDHADYLWLLRYADAMWELIRARKMRASFLERFMKEGARRLVESRSCKGRDFADSGYNYKQFGVNPYEGLAVSFGEAEITKLEYWDGIIDSAQRDCDTILQLMEARHDLFAHRARERRLHDREIERLEKVAIEAAPALAPDQQEEPDE